MDIFQHFLSHQSENTSSFSDIFCTAQEFHQLLGQKSYLLNHYLSMFFRLITEMDFCTLEDEIYQSIYAFSVKISIPLENTGVSSVFAASVWPFSLIFSLARRNEGNFFQAVPTTLSNSLAEVRLASLVAWA